MSKSKFQVGDVVKIVKKITERSPDFQNSWIEDMDEKIGSIQTIRLISQSGIYFEDITCGYPPKSLVKIGFSDFDEVYDYLKRGGYIISRSCICYRLKNGVLEINAPRCNDKWRPSNYNIRDLVTGHIADISQITKRKYYVHS